MKEPIWSADLWHVPAGGRGEKVIRSKFEAGTGASVSAFVVQILHGFDHLSSVLVRGEFKFNSGKRNKVEDIILRRHRFFLLSLYWVGHTHLEVSLYCIAPKRSPVGLTEAAKGLTIPARKPFTCRKLTRPMLEDPSIRKMISAACTLLHLPAKETWHRRWLRAHSHMGVTLRIGIIYTLSFGPFNGGQEENPCEHSSPHLHNLRGEKKSFVLLNWISNFRSALPLLPFVSFGSDIVHIGKWLLVNSKLLSSSSLSPPSSQFSRKPFVVCSAAHCGSFRCQIQVAGNIPARACFDPSINFDMMLHLSCGF